MDKITIERETLEDALEEAEDLFQAFGYVGATPKCSALRAALAAQPAEAQQEPVAWVIPGNDNASAKGFIDAMAWQEGEFSRPLYAAPPAPAAVPPGWLPIESAPKDGTDILVFNKRYGVRTDYIMQYGEFKGRWGCSPQGGSPTHWMPIPPPPQPAKDEL